MAARVLLVDNFDSFTYNVVQALRGLGAAVEVVRNDAIDVPAARAFGPSHLVVSPGPGRPEDAGRSIELIAAFLGERPLLGVCLGHQALAVALGGRIVPARRLMHGKTSQVHHRGTDLFAGLPDPFEAGRYHSLAVARAGLPEALRVTAESEDGEIMGLSHREHPAFGVQFHPESVLTPWGDRLLANFLAVGRA